jgi:hypothetical protein
MKFVIANPNLPWDWYGLSQNSNLTMDFVIANPDLPWNWYWISKNQFGFHSQKLKKKLAIELIHNKMHDWLYLPNTKDSRIGIMLRLGIKPIGHTSLYNP